MTPFDWLTSAIVTIDLPPFPFDQNDLAAGHFRRELFALATAGEVRWVCCECPLHAGDVSQQNQTPDPDRGSDSLVLNPGSMPPNQRLGTDDVKRL
jgi:hypothetical protein